MFENAMESEPSVFGLLKDYCSGPHFRRCMSYRQANNKPLNSFSLMLVKLVQKSDSDISDTLH